MFNIYSFWKRGLYARFIYNLLELCIYVDIQSKSNILKKRSNVKCSLVHC